MGQNITVPQGPYKITNFVAEGCLLNSTQPCSWSLNMTFVPDCQVQANITGPKEPAFNVYCNGTDADDADHYADGYHPYINCFTPDGAYSSVSAKFRPENYTHARLFTYHWWTTWSIFMYGNSVDANATLPSSNMTFPSSFDMYAGDGRSDPMIPKRLQ